MTTYANGRFPASALAPINGGAMLGKREAALFMALSAHGVKRGRPPCRVNGPLSGYRNLSGQVAMRRSWCARGHCGNAAVPGHSNHGAAKATDDDPATIVTIRLYGRPFGIQKAWSDASWEPWHHLVLVSRATVKIRVAPRVLRRGMRGKDVKGLQVLMRQAGAFKHDHKSGSYFSSRTALMLKRFQRAHKLKADGIAGPKTKAALRHVAKQRGKK